MSKEYKIGDTIVVDTKHGKYAFTILNVSVVDKHEKVPEGSRGIVIDYSYRNNNYDAGLLINENDFVLTDADDNKLEVIDFGLQNTHSVLKKGEFCKDKMSYLLRNDKNYIKMHYDENCNVSEDYDIILEW